eukprot:6198674-Pleurochrysis_carterae.AAC.1
MWMDKVSGEREQEKFGECASALAGGGSVSATSDGKLRVGGVIQVTRCIGDRGLRRLGLTAGGRPRVGGSHGRKSFACAHRGAG